jgi:hypothetical protein
MSSPFKRLHRKSKKIRGILKSAVGPHHTVPLLVFPRDKEIY